MPRTAAVSLFLRLSIPGRASPAGIVGWQAAQGEPTYGGQLQDFAATGLAAEGRMAIRYDDMPGPQVGADAGAVRAEGDLG